MQALNFESDTFLEDFDDTLDDDTFRIEDEPEFDEVEDYIDADEMGLLLAIAEDISRRPIDVDEDTDGDNWERASLMSNQSYGPPKRPFEKMIDDICAGRQGLFG